MAAAIVNLPPLEAGAGYAQPLQFEDGTGALVSLANGYLRMQVRPEPESTILLLDLDNGAVGGLVLDGPGTTLTMNVSAEQSKALALQPLPQGLVTRDDGSKVMCRLATWELKFTPEGGVPLRLCQGQFPIAPEGVR